MAIDKSLVHKIRIKHGAEKIILSLEEKGFCVAQLKDGSTEETESRDVQDFLNRTGSCSVAWIDYIVEDLKSEAKDIAMAMGFSGNVSDTLLKEGRAGYEDLDNEMGLLIPAIIVKGFDVHIEYLLILLRPGLVLTIHTTEIKRFFRLRRYAKIFMRKLKPSRVP